MRSDPSRIVQQLFHAPVRAHPGKVNRAERDCDVIHTVAISIYPILSSRPQWTFGI